MSRPHVNTVLRCGTGIAVVKVGGSMGPPAPAAAWRVAIAAAAAFVAVSAMAAPAAAQPPMELQWDERWRRADVSDYLLIGAFAWVAITAQVALIPDITA